MREQGRATRGEMAGLNMQGAQVNTFMQMAAQDPGFQHMVMQMAMQKAAAQQQAMLMKMQQEQLQQMRRMQHDMRLGQALPVPLVDPRSQAALAAALVPGPPGPQGAGSRAAAVDRQQEARARAVERAAMARGGRRR